MAVGARCIYGESVGIATSITVFLRIVFIIILPGAVFSAPVVESSVEGMGTGGSVSLALHAFLTNTVQVLTDTEDCFVIFPESPDAREAFTLISARARTHYKESPEGHTKKVFEMRYALRAEYPGSARLGGEGVEIHFVDANTFQTNILAFPDTVVTIEEKAYSYALLIIFIVAGVLIICVPLYCMYKFVKRRK
jgi:hypothetical protein